MSESVDKDVLISSLQEQLRKVKVELAGWICKYHGGANLFQKQKREMAELRVELAQIRKKFEDE